MQSAEQRLPSRRTARDLTLLIALTLTIHVPFIGQAFHLDDVYYLDVARNVFRNPLFPLDLQSVFEGKHLTLWAHSHPPLNSYLIAALLPVTNRRPSENFLHACFLVFPVLIAVAFYFLARQFVTMPLLATALLVTNPILMVCAHTLMTDVPHLAMWLSGTALFVIGMENDRSKMIYASVIPLTAACFYAYQGLGAILLLAFFALSRKRLRSREILILCLPVLILAAWQFSGYVHRGTVYMSAMFGELGRRGWWQPALKLKAERRGLFHAQRFLLFGRHCRPVSFRLLSNAAPAERAIDLHCIGARNPGRVFRTIRLLMAATSIPCRLRFRWDRAGGMDSPMPHHSFLYNEVVI